MRTVYFVYSTGITLVGAGERILDTGDVCDGIFMY